jgi:MFS family permease
MSGQSASSRLLPWLVVGFGFLVLALSYSGRATLGLVMPTVEQDMGWTRTFLSGSAAVSLIVMAVLAPLAGVLVDRHGPRMALIPIGFLLAFGGLSAIGHGVAAYHVVSAAVAQLFTRNLGLATGIATSGSTAGQFLIVPLIAGVLVVYGWRWSFVVVGVGCLVLVPVLWRLLPKHGPRAVIARGRDEGRSSLTADLRHVLRRPAFHILFWSFFICGYTTTGIIETHLIPFAAFCGFGPIPSANAYGILSAVNMAGMILVGWLTDRMHRPLLLGMIYLLRGLSFVLLINLAASADYGTLIFFAVAFGVVDYSTVPVTASLVESHIGLHVMGLAMGLIAAGHSVGAALGAFLGGYLFELQAHYDWIWISSIALSVLAGLLVFTLSDCARPMAAEEVPVA